MTYKELPHLQGKLILLCPLARSSYIPASEVKFGGVLTMHFSARIQVVFSLAFSVLINLVCLLLPLTTF